MKQKLLFRKTFLRYCITYSLILLLPITVLGTFAHRTFLSNIKQTTIENRLSSLLQTVDTVNMNWSNLEQFLLQLQQKNLFSARSLQTDSFQVMKAQKELYTFATTNGFAKDIFFYLPNTNLFFSCYSTYNPGWFAGSIYKYETITDSEFQRILNETTSMYTREDRLDTGKVSSIFLPFPLHSPSPYATVMITIDSHTFYKVCSSQLTGGSFFAILDRFGNPISLLNCPDNFSADKLLYSELPEQEAGLCRIDGIDYLVCRATSQVNGWQYFSFIPYSDALQEANTLERNNILILIVTILLGTVFVFLFSCFNYSPIRQLAEVVKSHQKQDVDIDSANELKWVQKIFIQTIENSNVLQQRCVDNNDSIRKLLLSSFLRGQITSVEELNIKGANVDLCLSPLPFRILVLGFVTPVPDEIDWSALTLQVLKRSFPSFCCGQSGNHFIFLLCDAGDENILKKTLTILLDQLNSNNYNAAVGVSELFDTAGAAPTAYIEAVTALDMRTLLGENHVYFFNDVLRQTPADGVEHTIDFDHLEKLLCLGDQKRIRNEINAICQIACNPSQSLFQARCICFSTLNCLMNTSVKFAPNNPLDWHRYDLFGVSKPLTTFELIDMIQTACNEFCIRFAVEQTLETDQKEILDYIAAHGLDAGFSIRQMAADFGMSDTNLSHLIKQKTGKNFTDHLNDLRIRYAKQLLRDTELPLKAIIAQIGYYDISSFIKKFKHIVGMTPGEYRQAVKNSSKAGDKETPQ